MYNSSSWVGLELSVPYFFVFLVVLNALYMSYAVMTQNVAPEMNAQVQTCCDVVKK